MEAWEIHGNMKWNIVYIRFLRHCINTLVALINLDHYQQSSTIASVEISLELAPFMNFGISCFYVDNSHVNDSDNQWQQLLFPETAAVPATAVASHYICY